MHVADVHPLDHAVQKITEEPLLTLGTSGPGKTGIVFVPFFVDACVFCTCYRPKYSFYKQREHIFGK